MLGKRSAAMCSRRRCDATLRTDPTSVSLSSISGLTFSRSGRARGDLATFGSGPGDAATEVAKAPCQSAVLLDDPSRHRRALRRALTGPPLTRSAR